MIFEKFRRLYFWLTIFNLLMICFCNIIFAEILLPPYSGAYIKYHYTDTFNFGSGYAIVPNLNYSTNSFDSSCTVFSWSTASFGISGMSVVDDYRIPILVGRSGRYKIDAEISIEGRIVSAIEDGFWATEFADIEVKMGSVLRDINENEMTDATEINLCVDNYSTEEIISEFGDTVLDFAIFYASTSSVNVVKTIAITASSFSAINSVLDYADSIENPLEEFGPGKPNSNHTISLTANNLSRGATYELSLNFLNKCIAGSYGFMATVLADSRLKIKVNSITLTCLDETDYVITANAGSNGSISPDGDTYIEEGDNKTFNALPYSGYEVDQWKKNGIVVQTGGSTYTVSNVQEDLEISVTFKSQAGIEYETITLTATEDIWVSSSSPDNNLDNSIIIGVQEDINDYYGLIKFNLNIPNGSVINDVELGLFCNYSNGPLEQLYIVESGSSWSESSVTWNTKPSFGGQYSFFYSVSGVGYQAIKNPDLINLVTGWINGTVNNYGLYLTGGNVGDSFSFGTIRDSDSSNNPKFIVTYTPLPPSDLIVTSLNPSPSPVNNTYRVDDNVSWIVTVKNIAAGPAGESDVGYYLETSPTDLSNKINQDSTDSLNFGETDSDSDSYVFEESDIGLRYLICKADCNTDIEETNEDNNTRVYGPFTVIANTPELSVNPASITVDKEAGAMTVTVFNAGGGTMSWTASVVSGTDWLSITSGSSGTNSGTININFSANASVLTRTGIIRVTSAGASGSPKDVMVIQSGMPVTFPDSNLETKIREAIGKPTGGIYKSDLEGLTELIANEVNISNLSGLEYCTNLLKLVLYNNQISDISPLSGLTNLNNLTVFGNQISDIRSLSGLINLTWLELSLNQISDISPLSGLINLTGLGMSSNDISDSDLNDLSGLINLRNLTLYWNQISDISPLSELIKLTWLLLAGNQISDISPLSGLINLRELNLGNNLISNGGMHALSGLINLRDLVLYSNQISDISSFSGLTNLTNLTLWNNQISDISVLSGLANLTSLYLSKNQIVDITALIYNTNLDYGDSVDLNNNPLGCETILKNIPILLSRGVVVDWTINGDTDMDDDGILNDDEDANHNSIVDHGETDPCNPDSDGDGIQDGTELGYTFGMVGANTDLDLFVPDDDPSTQTDPTNPDSDNDGIDDGEEDKNYNGIIDPFETNPDVESVTHETDLDNDGDVDGLDLSLFLTDFGSIDCNNCPNDFTLDGIVNTDDLIIFSKWYGNTFSFLEWRDSDLDGILDDGDFSGVAGDSPCIGGNTIYCDDNCIDNSNPDQIDSDGDGIGDECE